MKLKSGLLEILATTVILAVGAIGLIYSYQERCYRNTLKVTYEVEGKLVRERNFDTNEELQKYLKSERREQEIEYYSLLEKKKQRQ